MSVSVYRIRKLRYAYTQLAAFLLVFSIKLHKLYIHIQQYYKPKYLNISLNVKTNSPLQFILQPI